ncbi:hypothetical protein HDV00_011028 [Rhizophlyctis rosea]|nr:hypothetical protein HDV00_011028 [Rhizophlyctis rosea]
MVVDAMDVDEEVPSPDHITEIKTLSHEEDNSNPNTDDTPSQTPPPTTTPDTLPIPTPTDPTILLNWADDPTHESLTIPIPTSIDLDALEESMLDILLPPSTPTTPTSTALTLPSTSPPPATSQPGQPTLAGPTSIAFDIKKTQVGPNGEITTTTKSITFQVAPGQRDVVAAGGRVGTKRRGGGALRGAGRGSSNSRGGSLNLSGGVGRGFVGPFGTGGTGSGIKPVGVTTTTASAAAQAQAQAATTMQLKHPIDLGSLAAMVGVPIATPSSLLALPKKEDVKPVDSTKPPVTNTAPSATPTTTPTTTTTSTVTTTQTPATSLIPTTHPHLPQTYIPVPHPQHPHAHLHPQYMNFEFPKTIEEFTAMLNAHAAAANMAAAMQAAAVNAAAAAHAAAAAQSAGGSSQPGQQQQQPPPPGTHAVNIGVMGPNGVPVPGGMQTVNLSLAQLGLLGLVGVGGQGRVVAVQPGMYGGVPGVNPAGLPVVAGKTTTTTTTAGTVPAVIAAPPILTNVPVVSTLPTGLPSPPESTSTTVPSPIVAPSAPPPTTTPTQPQDISLDDLINTSALSDTTHETSPQAHNDPLHRWTKVPIGTFRRHRRTSHSLPPPSKWDIRSAVRNRGEKGKRVWGDTLLGQVPHSSHPHSPTLPPIRRRTSVTGKGVWSVFSNGGTSTGTGTGGTTTAISVPPSPGLFPGFGIISPALSPLGEEDVDMDDGEMEVLELDGGGEEGRKRRRVK